MLIAQTKHRIPKQVIRKGSGILLSTDPINPSTRKDNVGPGRVIRQKSSNIPAAIIRNRMALVRAPIARAATMPVAKRLPDVFDMVARSVGGSPKQVCRCADHRANINLPAEEYILSCGGKKMALVRQHRQYVFLQVIDAQAVCQYEEAKRVFPIDELAARHSIGRSALGRSLPVTKG